MALMSMFMIINLSMQQVLVGNKSDMADEKRAVPFSKGQALADEFGFRFFETSAKDNLNVTEVGTRFRRIRSCH